LLKSYKYNVIADISFFQKHGELIVRMAKTIFVRLFTLLLATFSEQAQKTDSIKTSDTEGSKDVYPAINQELF